MRFHVENIGKVESATIDMQGITVIAGENNTGKSTIGKSLFSIFNSFYRIQEQIERERAQSIINVLNAFYYIRIGNSSEKIKPLDIYARDILSKKDRYIENPQLLEEDYSFLFNPQEGIPIIFKSQYNAHEAIEKLIDILRISDDKIFNLIVNKKIEAEFQGQLLNIYEERDGIISLTVRNEQLNLRVGAEGLVVERSDYSLHTEAVYIDDPFVLDHMDLDVLYSSNSHNDHRKQLVYNLLKEKENTNVVDEIVMNDRFQHMYEKLQSVCSGSMVKQKNGRMIYRRGNTDRPLYVENLSTGLKTFVILKTLLMNGTIEENGTIILDEPEIHLHPEWQLRFAEIIVLLSEEFGVNILLNTHSPYFLRAIQVYSAKYGMADRCKYYLSESVEADRVRVVDVSEEIDKIFVKLAEPLQILENERWGID